MTADEHKVSLNDYVRVKLNECGRLILKQQRKELNEFMQEKGFSGFGELEIKEDAEGYTQFQLWHLMETFGPYMGLTLAMPFEMEIKIPVSPKSESLAPLASKKFF